MRHHPGTRTFPSLETPFWSRPVLGVLFPLLWAFSAVSCQPRPEAASAASVVFVSILPMQEWVERIGGDDIKVEVLVGSGQSPHTYEPTPRQMAALSQARLLFVIGVPFEAALLSRIQEVSPNLVVVDVAEGLRTLDVNEEDGHGDEGHGSHGGGHEGESHGDKDPHVWLDPVLAQVMVDRTIEALSSQFPRGEAGFRSRGKAYKEELTLATRSLEQLLLPFRGVRLLAYHGAYGYLCQRFGLEQTAVTMGAVGASARELAGMISDLKQHPVFVQKQFSVASAERLAQELGSRVVVLDPLAGNYLENLVQMAGVIAAALGGEK